MADLDVINEYLETNDSVIVPLSVLEELEQMAGVRVMQEVSEAKGDDDDVIETWFFEKISVELYPGRTDSIN